MKNCTNKINPDFRRFECRKYVYGNEYCVACVLAFASPTVLQLVEINVPNGEDHVWNLILAIEDTRLPTKHHAE